MPKSNIGKRIEYLGDWDNLKGTNGTVFSINKNSLFKPKKRPYLVDLDSGHCLTPLRKELRFL